MYMPLLLMRIIDADKCYKATRKDESRFDASSRCDMCRMSINKDHSPCIGRVAALRDIVCVVLGCTFELGASVDGVCRYVRRRRR